MSDSYNLDYLNSLEGEERFSMNNVHIEEIIEWLKEDPTRGTKRAVIPVSLDTETIDIRVNDLLFTLFLIPSRFALESSERPITFGEDFLHDVTKPKAAMQQYMDDTIDIFSGKCPANRISLCISNAIQKLAHYSWQINLFEGSTVNLYDLAHLAIENDEVNDLLHFQSEESSQFSEIEESVEAKTKRLIDILTSDETETCLKSMLSTVSQKQFQQAFVNISLKPDLYGRVIEKPINSSFLRGMQDSTEFFINAIGARKALTTNALVVRSAGYLSRKLSLLLFSTDLNHDVAFCGTDKLLPILIKDKTFSHRFSNKRNYKLNPKDKKFKVIRNEADAEKLVGKTIYLASPITCALSAQGKICKTCYGGTSETSLFHVGLTHALVLSNPIIQMLLSSKHLLQVVAAYILLNGLFGEYFTVDKNDIVAKEDCTIKILETIEDDVTGQKIITMIGLVDPEDPDSVTEFDIGALEFVLNPELESRLHKVEQEVEIKAGENAFRLEVENNELSAPLKRMLKLIESNKELEKFDTISDLVSELTDKLIESKISSPSLAVELIAKELARTESDHHVKSMGEDLKLMRLTNAVLHSSSASISLAFEQHAKLLEGPLFEKTGSSSLDYIF